MSAKSIPDSGEVKTIPLKFIQDNPLLMRGVDKEGNDFQELKTNISRFGILSPILVQPMTEDANGNMLYAVTNGMQRVTICRDLGAEAIPALIQKSNEIESLVKQIASNKNFVPTRRAEYGHALKMIITRQPTCTEEDLSHMTGQSKDWLKVTLALTRLTPTVATWCHENKVSMANQLKLVEIPDDKQDEYKERAATMSAGDFSGVVKDYKKAVAAAKAGQPKPERVYEPTPYARPVKEMMSMIEAPVVVDGHRLDKNTLLWCVKLDSVSVAEGKEKYEIAEREAKEKAEKAKEERAKKKLLEGK